MLGCRLGKTEMKELFRERDYARVGYYQSILEAEGIQTHVRNRDLVGMTTEVPIPEFFPALCVVNDEDYEEAMEILRESTGHGEADGEGVGEASEDEPFATTGIVFAGVLVIFGVLFISALMGFLMNLKFVANPDPPIGVLCLAGGVMLISLWAIIKVSLNYRATRRWGGGD